MLLSNQGVPDDVFIRLQSNMLEKLAGKLPPKRKMNKRNFKCVLTMVIVITL